LGGAIDSTFDSVVPLPVFGNISDIVDICTGGDFTLLRTASGKVYTYGDNSVI
jgi:alpha-tubulin suppressor-like RCC1 family protein